MLHRLPDTPAVHRTLAEARGELGDLGPADKEKTLATTAGSQVALLVAGVAGARALTEDLGLPPDYVAGHSVGAFGAAVAAGVLTFPEALAAVRLRGDLMRRAAGEGNWAMAALLGLREPAVRTLVERTATPDHPLWIACFNAADEIVLSGTADALDRAEEAARGAGARGIRRLAVATASHCPLQNDTARRLARHLSGVPRRRQLVPYLTNTRGRCVRSDPEAVLDDLARAVARPVRWYDATRLAAELGVTRAVQLPPGHVLVDLLSTAAPAVRAVAMDGPDIDRVVRALRRHREGPVT
ncbi:acyltransferase domain-containing protein [Streptomyces sp. SID13726]|nr:acyltransferase domain-containing protein [Streptomyces sp. SID13726]NEB03493.1 acyltransferase domain-containing protein [Streptomyces sp. SID13726]